MDQPSRCVKYFHTMTFLLHLSRFALLILQNLAFGDGFHSFYAFNAKIYSMPLCRRILVVSSLEENSSNDFLDNEMDDDDDDEVEIQPYGNRSLAWTKRYRKLNPYEKVRDRVIRHFGHRSKEDWDECVANGWHGQYVPSRPDEMYAPEWVSWDEFLGLMRPYNDTQNLAVNILGLKSLDDYILFARSNPKRAQGLRIPDRPDLFYKNKGWSDEKTFFRKNMQQNEG